MSRINSKNKVKISDMSFGAVKPRKRPEDFKKLRKEFMEYASERDERIKKYS